jgi:hypothetical protein
MGNRESALTTHTFAAQAFFNYYRAFWINHRHELSVFVNKNGVIPSDMKPICLNPSRQSSGKDREDREIGDEAFNIHAEAVLSGIRFEILANQAVTQLVDLIIGQNCHFSCPPPTGNSQRTTVDLPV